MKNLIRLLLLLSIISFPSYGKDFTETDLSQYEEVKVPMIVVNSIKGKTTRIELGLTEEEYNQALKAISNDNLPLFIGEATMTNRRGNVLYNLLLDESGTKYKDYFREDSKDFDVIYKGFRSRDGIRIKPKRGAYILSFKIYKHKNIKQNIDFFIKILEVDHLK